MTEGKTASADVRAELHQLLVADLVGPWGGPPETVVGNPRGRYLAGALAPVKIDTTVPVETLNIQAAADVADLREVEDPLVTSPDEASPGVPEAPDLDVAEW